jgi:hypothetical protein
VAIRDLKAEDVLIRIVDDVAIIHGCTVYTKPDGKSGDGRYTDVYAKQNGAGSPSRRT